MGTINLEDAGKRAEADPIWATRGKAIQAYASLEHSLCQLFAYLGSIDQTVASVIFFKITSHDVRNKIIEKLSRMKCGQKYRPFFNSLLKQLQPIDKMRNAIVHWDAMQLVGVDDAGSLRSVVKLKPPGEYRFLDADVPEISNEDLVSFTKKCDFYTRLCRMFCAVDSELATTDPSFDVKRWLAVFERQIVYPPSADHPLGENAAAGGAQVRTSVIGRT